MSSETPLEKFYQWYCGKIYRNYNDVRGVWRGRQILRQLLSKYLSTVKGEEPVVEKDWDNLIILDAARYDTYQKVSERETEHRVSVGSKTSQYIERTFSEGQHQDIVYISANPHFENEVFENLTGRKPDEVFHEVFHTYSSDWDSKENTVLPESVIRDFKTAKNLFPDKKIVAHFMQPHYPFIGSELTKGGIRPDLDSEKEKFSLWEKAEMGDYDKEELQKAYEHNLEIVLEEVDTLCQDIEGKTVITSDHGNLIGEKGLYGHPELSRDVEQLHKVPWDVK